MAKSMLTLQRHVDHLRQEAAVREKFIDALLTRWEAEKSTLDVRLECLQDALLTHESTIENLRTHLLGQRDEVERLSTFLKIQIDETEAMIQIINSHSTTRAALNRRRRQKVRDRKQVETFLAGITPPDTASSEE